MKKLFSTITILALFSGVAMLSANAAGEKIYKTKGCKTCHSPTQKKTGPAFKTISATYKADGGKEALVKFLSGNGQPKVWPKKFGTMKGQLNKTKKLSDQQKSDLADYILSN